MPLPPRVVAVAEILTKRGYTDLYVVVKPCNNFQNDRVSFRGCNLFPELT